MVHPSLLSEKRTVDLLLSTTIEGQLLAGFIKSGSEVDVVRAIAETLIEHRTYNVSPVVLLKAPCGEEDVFSHTFCSAVASKHAVMNAIVRRIKEYSVADKIGAAREKFNSTRTLETELSIVSEILPSDWELTVSVHPKVTFHVNDANCSTVLTGDGSGDFLFALAMAAEDHPSSFDFAKAA